MASLLQVISDQPETLTSYEQVLAVVKLLDDADLETDSASATPIDMGTSLKKATIRERLIGCCNADKEMKPTTRLFVLNTLSTFLMALALICCAVIFMSSDNFASHERSLHQMNHMVSDAVLDFAYIQAQVLLLLPASAIPLYHLWQSVVPRHIPSCL